MKHDHLSLKLKASYTLTCKDVNGKETFKYKKNNLITTVGKTMAATILSDTEATGLFQYFAFGDGVVSPDVSDTTLSSEVGRVAVTTLSNTLNVISVGATVTFGDMVGFTLSEVGIFGLDALGSTDSGSLFSRVLISPTINKTNITEIDVLYELTIT